MIANPLTFIYSDHVPSTMTETLEGKRSPIADLASDFKSLGTKQLIGIIVAVMAALIIEVFMGSTCVGFFIAAIVLYMVPHILGVSSVKVKAVVGAIFIVLAMLIGTFGFSGTIEDYQNNIDTDGETIMDAEFDLEAGTLTVYVKPPEDLEGWHLLVREAPLDGLSFGMPRGSGYTDHELTPDQLQLQENGWYLATVTGLANESGELYHYQVAVMPNEEGQNPEEVLTFMVDTGCSFIGKYFTGTAYTVALAAIIFYLVLVFSTLMRNSADKTRKKMEAEGRLYPQGYGRCKNCGAMVLPGEVNCRKCGTYIDVPDELRVQKKDFFQCSECGAEVPSDATECPRCGVKFDEAETEILHSDGSVDVSTEDIHCPACGSAVPENAEWCPKCGKMFKE